MGRVDLYRFSRWWWFRLTPRTEIFFDEVMTPGFAYEFINITKTYAYPKPFLKDKIRTYVTHGAPSLPVYPLLEFCQTSTRYGCLQFCIRLRWSLWFKTKQFWSVPLFL